MNEKQKTLREFLEEFLETIEAGEPVTLDDESFMEPYTEKEEEQSQ